MDKLVLFMLLQTFVAAGPDPVDLVRNGNDQYNKGRLDQAITEYDKALAHNPGMYEAIFNKANAYYRMDDMAKAIELYQDVSSRSKDTDLVKKAKYNLGNAHFQLGLKFRDSDPRKALEYFKASIGYWRSVLDMDQNQKPAKHNKEVAGLLIKDILDQLNKQAQQAPDPNQTQTNNPQGQTQQQQKASAEGSESNQVQAQQGTEPNQPSSKQDQVQTGMDQVPDDTTADQIIQNEQLQRQNRQQYLRADIIPVDKDW